MLIGFILFFLIRILERSKKARRRATGTAKMLKLLIILSEFAE